MFWLWSTATTMSARGIGVVKASVWASPKATTASNEALWVVSLRVTATVALKVAGSAPLTRMGMGIVDPDRRMRGISRISLQAEPDLVGRGHGQRVDDDVLCAAVLDVDRPHGVAGDDDRVRERVDHQHEIGPEGEGDGRRGRSDGRRGDLGGLGIVFAGDQRREERRSDGQGEDRHGSLGLKGEGRPQVVPQPPAGRSPSPPSGRPGAGPGATGSRDGRALVWTARDQGGPRRSGDTTARSRPDFAATSTPGTSSRDTVTVIVSRWKAQT